MVGFKKIDMFIKTGTGVFVFAVAFFAAFLSSSHFMPVKVSNAETNGAYYANITSSGAIDINIDATPDGYGKVGKDELTIDTNATAGYKLYLSTTSSAPGNGLYLSTDSSKSITATTGTLSQPSKLSTNTWGFAPSRANDSATPATYTDADADAKTGSAVFAGVPEYGSENIIYTNNSPSTAGTNSVDIYYGVNASTALDSGEYSNAVVYTAIVDAVNPSSENITLSPVSQEGLDAGTPITISTGLYPGFSADNLGNITVTIGGNACTNITPSVAEAGNLNITCTAPAASAAGKYDVVVNVAKYGKTYTMTEGYEYTGEYMQDFSAAEHESDATGTEYANLIDSRDGKIYSAKKLADGNVWMMKNLELDLPSGQASRTLTPEDSDVSADWPLTDNSNGTPGWCNQDTDACDNQKLISRTGYTGGGQTAPTYYYNWYTATAGTGTSAIASGDVSDSICPKGWKLPTTAQFQALDQAYGGTGANRTDANQITNFTQNVGFGFTGSRTAASVYYSTSGAFYWSRSADSATNAYHLGFISGNDAFHPQGSSSKWIGFAVRCVAATSMQDFSATAHAADAVGTTYNLTDSRDNKEYSAKKLADGNIWMMKNLELDLPAGQTKRTLTPDDSDVTANWDLEDANNWCNQDTDACDNQKLISRTGYTGGGNTAPTYYYNWYTATAGTGTRSVSSGNVNDSICPKGWKLPTTAQFQALDQAYGGTGENRTDANQITNFTQNVGFGFTGYRNAASVGGSTSGALYWSRSAHSATYAYSLNFYSDSGNFYPQYFNDKWYGFAVRCVADNTMQGFKASDHSSDATDTTYELVDNRDGQKYTAAKLADGNIWMAQDLKLGGSSALTLTPDDSDITSNYTLPAENTGTWCTDQTAACYNQSLMRKTGVPNGYLYNWYAATAGTGVYGTGAGVNATASICPKGWKLPTGGASGQFKALDIAYGGTGSNRTGDTTQVNKFLASPLNFNYTGYVYGGSVDGPSVTTYYWSRTANSEPSAYNLYFDSSGLFYPQPNSVKYGGYAVRCVAAH